MDRTPMRRQVAQSTRGFDSASLQQHHFPASNTFGGKPAIGLQPHSDIGSGRPVRARHTISLPRRSAMAAPVAPVRACAFSAMMLMPGSRSISPALSRACGTAVGP